MMAQLAQIRLTATTLMGLGMGTSGITYSGLSHLNIYLGASGNTFTVVTTAPGTTNHITTDQNDTVNIRTISGPTTVTTLTGSNTINVGSTAGQTPASSGNLAGIQAALTIVGTGHDTLNLDDRNDTLQRNGTITSSQITGFGLVGRNDIGSQLCKRTGHLLGNCLPEPFAGPWHRHGQYSKHIGSHHCQYGKLSRHR